MRSVWTRLSIRDAWSGEPSHGIGLGSQVLAVLGCPNQVQVQGSSRELLRKHSLLDCRSGCPRYHEVGVSGRVSALRDSFTAHHPALDQYECDLTADDRRDRPLEWGEWCSKLPVFDGVEPRAFLFPGPPDLFLVKLASSYNVVLEDDLMRSIPNARFATMRRGKSYGFASRRGRQVQTARMPKT